MFVCCLYAALCTTCQFGLKKQRFFFPTPYCVEFPLALSTLALVHVNFTCNFDQFCVVQTEVHPEVVKFEVRHRLKVTQYLPSGKLLHSYGTSPFLMGKSTINGHFQ